MSTDALRKLWSFFALAALSLSFLFFLRTTSHQASGSAAFGLLGYSPAAVPALGLPLVLGLTGISLLLTWTWSRYVGGSTWAHRFPTFHFEPKDIDPGARGGKVYQGVSLFLTMVLQEIFLIQMTARFFRGQVFHVTSGGPGQPEVSTTAAHHWRELFAATHLRSFDSKPGYLHFGAPDGPEFLWWTPWLYGTLSVAVMIFWAATMWSIFAPRKSAPHQSTGA